MALSVFKSKYRWIAFAGILIFSTGMFLLIFANQTVKACEEKIYSSIEKIPPGNVGLLLGTNPFVRGQDNLYFTTRIKAAAALYHRRKIRKILVSGDNRYQDYNEPEAMSLALQQLGIPEKDIVLDYAGFRTLDSVVRAKKIFLCKKLTVISQKFHCERAIFIAEAHEISAIGFAAEDPGGNNLPVKYKLWLRECLARFVAFLDVRLFHRTPYFLGEPIRISGMEESVTTGQPIPDRSE